MNSLVFAFAIFLFSASIYSVSAVTCDFCPKADITGTNKGFCEYLLTGALEGTLFKNEDECNFNKPILNQFCGCTPIDVLDLYTPCDPCGANLDAGNHIHTTFSKPAEKLELYNRQYACSEILYSARNGGVKPSECAALSASEVGSVCGSCEETVKCDIDGALCRPSTKLAASNKGNFPQSTDIWSTALSCDELIKGAREGYLLSSSGCEILKKSIDSAFRSTSFTGNTDTAFRPRSVDIDIVDLGECGLQCDYDPNSSLIQGRFEMDSDMPSDGPSVQPSEVPTLEESDMPSNLPSMMITSPPKKKRDATKNCLRCDFENDSAFYLYKDFGQAGVTFFEALSAPDHQAECKEPHGECDMKELLYPDLESCYLAGVTTLDEIISIQAVVPPEKSAYISLYKDTIAQFKDAKSCNESIPDFKCEEESSGGFGLNKAGARGILAPSKKNSGGSLTATLCPALKKGWSNYGSDVEIPSSIWNNGELSYCFSGPIQNAAAVWPVEANGYNYGDLRDVNAGWKLPGAVYKCCKSLQTCSVSTSTD